MIIGTTKFLINHGNYILRDHCVLGINILPGLAFIDILYRAIQPKIPLHEIKISNLLFIQPLAISEAFDVQVKISFNSLGNGWQFVIAGRKVKDEQILAEEWNVYCQGEVYQAEALGLKTIYFNDYKLQKSVTTFAMEQMYDFAKSMNIYHGPFMQIQGEIFTNQNFILAKLFLSNLADTYHNQFSFHPAIIDGSALLGFIPFLKMASTTQKMVIPFFVKSFQALKQLPSPCYVYVTLESNDALELETTIATFEYYDESGQRIAIMEGLIGKEVRQIEHIQQAAYNNSSQDLISSTQLEETQVLMQQESSEQSIDKSQLVLVIAHDLSEMIQHIFAKNLDKNQWEQKFYNIGLDSVQLVQLVHKLEDKLSEQLYPTLLFEFDTINKLANYLAQNYRDKYINYLMESQLIAEHTQADYQAVQQLEVNQPEISKTIAANTYGDTAECYYYPGWVQLTLADQTASDLLKESKKLFLAPDRRFAEELLKILIQEGHTNTIIAVVGDHYCWLNKHLVEINISAPDDYTQLIADLKQVQQLPECVVFALAHQRDVAAKEINHCLTLSIFSLWHFFRAYIQDLGNRPLKIIYSYPADGINQPFFACTAGWLRTLKLEISKYSSKVIGWSFEPEKNHLMLKTWLTNIQAELLDMHTNKVHEIKYSRDSRLIKQWINYTRDFTYWNDSLIWKPGGIYLITGGLGDLSLALVKEIVRKEAVKLILVGRSALSQEKKALINQLNKEKAQVIYHSADISKREEVIRLLSEIGALTGIIHAAGILNDKLIINQNESDITAVIAAKVYGTYYLDAFTKAMPLDFFICFSSISSETGNAGQSTYSLANCFLDQFAAWREQQTKIGERSGKSLSINWPLWSETNMQVSEERKKQLYQRYGMNSFPSVLGLAVFNNILMMPYPQVMLLYGDKTKMEQTFPIIFGSSLLRVPLSISQQQLYTIYQLNQQSADYNIGFAIQLQGPFDLAIFTQALNHVIERHEVLRTTYSLEADTPVAIINSAFKVKIPLVSIAETSTYAIEKQKIDNTIERLRLEPFTLADLPLFRTQLLRLNNEEHIFVAIFHHIIMDAWSLMLFEKELISCDELFKNGEIASLNPISYHYSDYINWQQERLNNANLPVTLAFWREQVREKSYVLQLPTDNLRTQASPLIKKVIFNITDRLYAELKQIAQQHHVTLFACLLSAYQLVLSRYAQQADIIVGVPFLGRETQAMQKTLGVFINTLPMAARLHDSLLFSELMQWNQKLIEQTRAHQHLPLATLLAELKIDRSLSIQPLFQVLFNFISFPVATNISHAMQSKLIWEESGRPTYDLNFEIDAIFDKLELIVKYNANLFELTTIENIAEHFIILLEEIVKNPTQITNQINLLTHPEKTKLLIEWNHTLADYPKLKLLHQIIEEQADRTPEHIALIFEDKQLTYRELNTKANQLAHYLLNQGIDTETIIAISLERSLELIVALLAVLKAGGAYLPLDHSNPQDRLDFMLRDSQSALIITHSNFKNKFPNFSGKLLCLDQHSSVFQMPENEHNPSITIKSQQLAYVIYTSGSTGTPKGVLIEHQSVINCLYAIQSKVQINSDDIFLAVTSLSFDVATLDYFLPLAIGAKTIIASQANILNPKRLIDLMNQHHPSIMQATPALWRMLVKAGWQAEPGFKVLTAGEALSKELAAALLQLHCEVFNIYGPTEATIYATMAKITSSEIITIGKPLPNMQAYILDANQQLLPIGLSGELYIGGAGVARGYLNQQELTQARFIHNPFSTEIDKELGQNLRLYRTGDLVRYLSNGDIQYLGRIDQQVKLRGYRIELEEIENTLMKLPEISQAVVSLYQDRTEHKQLIAFLVLNQPEFKLNTIYVQSQLAKFLPDYMIPAQFFSVEAIPISTNGKIDKMALLDLVQAEIINSPKIAKIDTELSPLQKQVCTDLQLLAADILAIDFKQIDLLKPFGEYGYDSIRFGEFSAKISRKYAIDINPAVFYRYTNLKLLANYLIETFGEALQNIFPATLFTNVKPAKSIINNSLVKEKEKQNNLYYDNYKEVAIIGIACKAPGSLNVDAFWQNLIDGNDLISIIPEQRWDWRQYADYPGTKWGGFIEGIDQFDADFFNITPLEAELMDPQQRLLLESVWQTIEDAGYKASDLSGSNTGVFIGSTGAEYFLMQQSAGLMIDSHSISGNAQSITANRISYFFNFKGPSNLIDTACSSSLVAVHRAVVAINAGECDMAIVGGINLLLTPAIYQGLSKMNMLSADGHCKAFDESANGYVRGEGVITLLLKPLQQAQADNDHIYAVIKSTAENHGGKTHGLTVPNPEAQSELVMRACQKANIDPTTITYIEAHGTGTKLGDPIEIDGLKQAFNSLAQARQIPVAGTAYCAIGSVKSNIGHLEGAAGIAGLLKVILAMQHKKLPASLHLKQLNPAINLTDSPFHLLTESCDWNPYSSHDNKPIPRRAGVSSFGFGGSNAHVIVEEAPPFALFNTGTDKPYYLIALSAKQPESLLQKIDTLAVWLANNTDKSLADIAYTLNIKREHFAYRCAFVVDSYQDLQATLKQVQSQQKPLNYLYSTESNQKHYEPVFKEILLKIFTDLKDYQQLSAVDYQQKLLALADLYCKGYDLNWELLHQNEFNQRISLPTYPFLHKRFWFNSRQIDHTQQALYTKNYYEPVWQQQILITSDNNIVGIKSLCVFSDNVDLVNNIRQQLNTTIVIQICSGDCYRVYDEQTYQVRLVANSDYEQLLLALKQSGINLSHFVFARYLDPDSAQLEEELHEQFVFTQTLLQQIKGYPIYFLSLYQYNENKLMPKQSLASFAKSIMLENSYYFARVVGMDTMQDIKLISQQLLGEFTTLGKSETAIHVRYKADVRYTEYYQLLKEFNGTTSTPCCLKNGGVYLITGGLGGLGFQVAKYLARTYQAKLILTGRSPLDAIKQNQLQELNNLGAKVSYLQGDVTHKAVAETWVEIAKQSFGSLNGVIHCAGHIHDALLVNKTWDSFKAVLAAKVTGTLHLDNATAKESLDCFILFSSLTGCLGGISQADYAYANAYLNAFAVWRDAQTNLEQRRGKTIAINWSYWQADGMRLSDFFAKQQIKAGIYPLSIQDGLHAFAQILQQTRPVVAVLYGDSFKISQLFNNKPIEHLAEESAQNYCLIITKLIANHIGLQPEKLEPELSLFEQGVDSILLAQILSKIEQELQCDLNNRISAILNEPSISNIARQISPINSQVPASSSAIVEERLIAL